LQREIFDLLLDAERSLWLAILKYRIKARIGPARVRRVRWNGDGAPVETTQKTNDEIDPGWVEQEHAFSHQFMLLNPGCDRTSTTVELPISQRMGFLLPIYKKNKR
jgi:hypothetical protein